MAARWLERGLAAAGVILAAVYGVVLLQTCAVSRRPVPPRSAQTERPETGEWVARLDAPSAHLTATILEGTDDGTLARAAGHLEETALPGGAGNVGIAGHRDTVFRPLRHVRRGDPIVLTTADRVYRYRVVSTEVVAPDAVWVLDAAAHPTLTLVTCYPFGFFGSAPDRFIVRADLIGEAAR